MANEEHVALLRQGVEVWNQWRRHHMEIRPDLSGADLSGANLSRAKRVGAKFIEPYSPQPYLNAADLSGADLSGAKLVGAHLSGSHLLGADLSGADLSGADLSAAHLGQANLRRAHLFGVDLSRADLGRAHLNGANLLGANLHATDFLGADLSGADLSGAAFSKANLFGVDLSEARVGGSNFGNVDLSAAKGLDTVKHGGPSTIGIDTIYKSEGKIPEAFLRGAGVPDEFITFMHSLVAANAIQFYSCFISYSSKDEGFAKRVYADLQANNVRCWFAPEDIRGGRKLHEQIDEAIRYHDKLLLVLSENSMNSEWVKTEIRRARREEAKSGCRKLFPICLVPFSAIRDWEAFDADIGKDMAVEVREYFIPDFSWWEDHAAYQKAFARLLRDLKAENAIGGAS